MSAPPSSSLPSLPPFAVFAVFAPEGRRLQQRERHRVHARYHQGADFVRPVGERIHVVEQAEEVRLLQDHRRRRGGQPGEGVGIDEPVLAVGQRHDLDALVAHDGPGRGHVERVRVPGNRDYARPAAAGSPTVGPYGHQHRFGQSGAAVVDRSVADVHPGQFRHHGLELVDELQRALARLRLVRGVRGHELPAARDVPDRRRHVVVVRPGPQEARPGLVPPGALAEATQDFHLGQPVPDGGELAGAEGGRYLVEQRLDVRDADGGEHLRHVRVGMGYERHPSSTPNRWGVAAPPRRSFPDSRSRRQVRGQPAPRAGPVSRRRR